MSTYFSIYQVMQTKQYQVMLLLAVVGLGWGLAWLLIKKAVPARWHELAQWLYIILATVLGGLTMLWVKGG
jgi:hypothetical protein